jgi:hypothetical protein
MLSWRRKKRCRREIMHQALSDAVPHLNQFAADLGIAGPSQRYAVVGNELRHDPSAAAANAVFLPFVAQRISLKSNLRIVGIDGMPGTTAKVMLASHGARPSVLRDVRGRRVLLAHVANSSVGIPVVRSYDRNHARWLLEDFIPGREATDADLSAFVAQHAASVTLPLARLARVRRAPRLGPMIDALDWSLRAMFPPVGNDAMWPVAFSHNDLNPDNLLIDAGQRMWLLDWEISGVAPLVADLGRVYLRLPDLRGTILALLAAADPEGRALPPRHQLALGASRALQRNAHIHVHNAVWRRGLSEPEARREIEGMINDARRMIAQLAA